MLLIARPQILTSCHPNFQRPRRRVSVGAPDKIKPGAEYLGLLDLVSDLYLIKVSLDVLGWGLHNNGYTSQRNRTGRLGCFVDHWGYTVVRRHTKVDRTDYNCLTVTTAIKTRLGCGWDLWRSLINYSTHLGAVNIVESYCLRAIADDVFIFSEIVQYAYAGGGCAKHNGELQCTK